MNFFKGNTLIIAVTVTAIVLVTSVLMADWTQPTAGQLITEDKVGISLGNSTTGNNWKSNPFANLLILVQAEDQENWVSYMFGRKKGLFIRTSGIDAGDSVLQLRGLESTSNFIFTGTGKVGIGTTTPSSSSLLDVRGLTTSTNYACSSDVRYKKDVSPYQNALQKVLGLQGVNYFWKADEYKEQNFSKDKQIGFIAQEVEKVIPELVYTDDKGYKTMSYDRLTAVLVEAVKEMKKEHDIKVSELKIENEKNQSKISLLEKENEELKQKLATLESVNGRVFALEKAMEKYEAIEKVASK